MVWQPSVDDITFYRMSTNAKKAKYESWESQLRAVADRLYNLKSKLTRSAMPYRSSVFLDERAKRYLKGKDAPYLRDDYEMKNKYQDVVNHATHVVHAYELGFKFYHGEA